MVLKGRALSFLGQKDSINYPLTSRQQKICCDIFTWQKMETGPEVNKVVNQIITSSTDRSTFEWWLRLKLFTNQCTFGPNSSPLLI